MMLFSLSTLLDFLNYGRTRAIISRHCYLDHGQVTGQAPEMESDAKSYVLL